MPSGKYDRLTGDEPPLPAGAVIYGIRRYPGNKFAVVRVTQLIMSQKEEVVRYGLTEQEAERIARHLQQGKAR